MFRSNTSIERLGPVFTRSQRSSLTVATTSRIPRYAKFISLDIFQEGALQGFYSLHISFCSFLGRELLLFSCSPSSKPRVSGCADRCWCFSYLTAQSLSQYIRRQRLRGDPWPDLADWSEAGTEPSRVDPTPQGHGVVCFGAVWGRGLHNRAPRGHISPLRRPRPPFPV